MKNRPNIFITGLLASFVLVLITWALSGCSLFSTPPEKVAKQEAKVDTSNKAVIAEGQAELAGAAVAANALPPGRARDVTLDFLNRGADLVAQGNGPLDAARALKMRDIALARLSEEAAARDKAEKELAGLRGKADEVSAENGRLKGELKDLQGQLAVSWQTEHETAGKWRGLIRWLWIIGGVWVASIVLPIVANIFSGGAAGPVLGIASKAFGYIASPAIQFAKDRAVGGLVKMGHALEDFRQDAPQFAARITRKFDSYTDADHQSIVGEAAKDYRENIRPLEVRAPQPVTATAA